MPADLDVIATSARKILEIYELTDCEFARALGTDSEALALLSNSSPESKTALMTRQYEQQLIALYQNLRGLLGDDNAAAIRWLRCNNVDLGSRPIKMLGSIEGIRQVNAYLANYRCKS